MSCPSKDGTNHARWSEAVPRDEPVVKAPVVPFVTLIRVEDKEGWIPRSSSFFAVISASARHVLTISIGYAAGSLSMSFAQFWHSQVPFSMAGRVSGLICGS